MYTYAWYEWLFFFFIYCFIGWCFESAYVSLKERRFVNRGFLKSPMLPIYGFGAVGILIVTIPVRNKLALVFIFGMISATVLEFVTGALMEAIFKVRYWDYSNQKFNVKGYICLSSSIAWGFLSVLLTAVIHTPIESLMLGMNRTALAVIDAVVALIFSVDLVISFKAAIDLRRVLEKLTDLKAQVEEMEAKLADAAGEYMDKAGEYKDKLVQMKDEKMEQLSQFKDEKMEQFGSFLEERKDQSEEKREQRKEQLALLKAEYLKAAGQVGFFMRTLLKNNPGVKSNRFGSALSELKDRLKRKGKHDEGSKQA